SELCVLRDTGRRAHRNGPTRRLPDERTLQTGSGSGAARREGDLLMSAPRSRKSPSRRRTASIIMLAAATSLQLVGATSAHAAAAVGLVSSFGANAYGE